MQQLPRHPLKLIVKPALIVHLTHTTKWSMLAQRVAIQQQQLMQALLLLAFHVQLAATVEKELQLKQLVLQTATVKLTVVSLRTAPSTSIEQAQPDNNHRTAQPADLNNFVQEALILLTALLALLAV